ncbi:MAG: DUF1570 domain-containing protein [Planctomycetota bacterium]
MSKSGLRVESSSRGWGAVVFGRALLVVVIITASFGVAPRATAGLDELSRFESRFYVLHTNLTREEALEYGEHMDLIFREYTKRFAVLRGDNRQKQNLYLLRTRGDYIATMAEFGIPAQASGGMFFWGPRGSGLSTWTEGLSRNQVFSTLQHEGFHQFAHSKLGHRLPLWVNEGLAEYFGSAIVVKNRVRLGVVDEDRIKKIRAALENDSALGFGELLYTTSDQWHNNMLSGSPKGSLQYDQSWSIVHFLIHGDKGRYQKAFENYLVQISKGKTHEQAFAQSFGANDTKPFAKRWKKFLNKVEADPYSTALKRLQFLGAGLEFLAGQEGVELPADMAGLKQALQARGFRVTWMTEAGEREVDASDETQYGYTGPRDQPAEFELLPAEEGSGLPPRVTASKLKPTATLVWTRDSEGNLRSRLEFK